MLSKTANCPFSSDICAVRVEKHNGGARKLISTEGLKFIYKETLKVIIIIVALSSFFGCEDRGPLWTHAFSPPPVSVVSSRSCGMPGFISEL